MDFRRGHGIEHLIPLRDMRAVKRLSDRDLLEQLMMHVLLSDLLLAELHDDMERRMLSE